MASRHNSAPRDDDLALTEPGFYELTRPDAPAERPTIVAVNADRAESDPSRIEPAELARLVQPDGRAASVAAAAEGITVEDRERQQSIWWWLLAGAMVVLGIEMVVANRVALAARL